MKKFSSILNEKLIINKKTKNKSILFTDIVDSANKWKYHKDDMITALEKQSILFDKLSEKYNGNIIKTIGDAYMISFDNIKDSILFAIEIQKTLKNKPIEIQNKKIIIRIGICYGEVYESSIKIQNNNLIDYLGNTVNSSSRIESKVCKPGNVAFSSLNNDIDLKDFLKDFNIDVFRFKDDDDDNVKRSGRLLTDVQRYFYKNIDELKGINELDVYHIIL